MGEEMERRMREHTDIETLLRIIGEATDREVARIRAVPEENYDLPIELPWPPPMNVVDAMGYHNWNMAYHEGQIHYIASLLENSPTDSAGV